MCWNKCVQIQTNYFTVDLLACRAIEMFSKCFTSDIELISKWNLHRENVINDHLSRDHFVKTKYNIVRSISYVEFTSFYTCFWYKYYISVDVICLLCCVLYISVLLSNDCSFFLFVQNVKLVVCSVLSFVWGGKNNKKF